MATSTTAKSRRLRVKPAPGGAAMNAVLCPICQQRMTMSLLVSSHLNDHHYGLFGAQRTGPIRVEVALLVEET